VAVRRREVDGRGCFDETEAVRERGAGLWRGLLSVLCCLDSARRCFVAGTLWDTTGVGAGGRTGGLRDVALGAESAELFEAAVKLEYPESLRRSMLAGIVFSGAGELRSLDRLDLTLAAVGDELRGALPLGAPASLSSEQSSTCAWWASCVLAMAGSVVGRKMGAGRARRVLPKSNVSGGRAIDNPRSVGLSDSSNHARRGRGMRMLPSHGSVGVRVYIEGTKAGSQQKSAG
jgi:hypothetical protein